ncbi:MAG TPA: restriction endonuclease subunit S [bacterium]|nr:restriction endonuclease subunit S [bacterium]
MIDVREDFLKIIKNILKQNVPDCEVRAFGSRVDWTATDSSDLDLAIVGKEKLNWKIIAKLKSVFEESILPFRVDILDWHSIPENFRKNILKKFEVIQKIEISKFKNRKIYRFSDFVLINPIIKLDNQKEYSFVEMKDLSENNKYVYPSNKRKLSGGARFQNHDTLFARITPCLENGKICQVKNLENGVGFGSTEFLVFRGKYNISDNDFVYYLSRSDIVRRFAEQNMIGTSGRQRVSKDSFDNLEIEVSDLHTQTRISAILSALDDKIELNRATNKTLEEIAQAIFKEWFVNFNFPASPAGRPDENGNPYKDSGGEMISREQSVGAGSSRPNNTLSSRPNVKIPKNWRVMKLGEIGCFKNGINYSRDENGESEYFIVNVRNIVESKFINKNKLDKIMIDKKKAKPYELLADDILIVRSASPGETAILLQNEDEIIYSGFTIRYRFDNKNLFFYLFFVFQNLKNIFNNLSNGTTLKNINQEMLNPHQVIIPDDLTIKLFNKIIIPIFNRIQCLNEQSDFIAQIRDALLPKLMNGEIDVSVVD